MSNSRYSATESQLTISPPKRSASARERDVLPPPVGPSRTTSSGYFVSGSVALTTVCPGEAGGSSEPGRRQEPRERAGSGRGSPGEEPCARAFRGACSWFLFPLGQF